MVVSFILEDLDSPPPPPVPDQVATVVSADILTEEDTVTAIELELELALGQRHKPQIPPESSFGNHGHEEAEVINEYIG